MSNIIELSLVEKKLVCGGEKEEKEELYYKKFPCEGVPGVDGSNTVFSCYDVRQVKCYENAPGIGFWRAWRAVWDIFTSPRIIITAILSVVLGVYLESKIPYSYARVLDL